MVRNTGGMILSHLTIGLMVLLHVSIARPLWAQTVLENPQPAAFLSGIGLVSGWACNAERIEIVFDGAVTLQAAYGTSREDTVSVCGDANNGFGLLFNWNLLGEGTHTVQALADGEEFANVTVTVRTFGAEFLQGASGQFPLADFPQAGTTTVIRWEESLQSFVLAMGEPVVGGNSGDDTRRLENPQPGSFQSGIGILSGWACDAEQITIVFDNTITFEAASGTSREDTRDVCGDANNGFGLLFNWNLLGEGPHTVQALADGEEFARATVTVTTLGTEFLRGASGRFPLDNFLQAGTQPVIRWEESLQNFVLVDGGPRPPFTAGVASGDVTPTSAVLWTRLDQEGEVTVEVATTPAFQGRLLTQTVQATAATDFTAKVEIAPLSPDQTYFYRWQRGAATSAIGHFRTPPVPEQSAAVRFAYSGDSDGTPVEGRSLFDFQVLEAARAEHLNFFVYLGDTAYTDSRLRDQRAVTLEEYRAPYKENRAIAALRNLLEFTPISAIWDDHEVRNDYDGRTVDPQLYANGRQAFLEYQPVAEASFPIDPTCAGPPLFRVFHWGAEVDVIILDERSCRSEDADDECSLFGIPSLAPTLPGATLEEFGLPGPPSGCRDAIFDDSRTLLGPVQKQRFKNALLTSTAKFKFVINEVPIQQFYFLPYDRWEGYGAERTEVLEFIRINQITNVIFLTTDTHATLLNEVFIDHFTDPTPIAYEVVTGPIGTFTFEEEAKQIVDDLDLDDLGLDPDLVVDLFHGMLDLVEVDCRHLDRFSYGLVDVPATAGASITVKDETGAVVHDQQQASLACTKQLGS